MSQHGVCLIKHSLRWGSAAFENSDELDLDVRYGQSTRHAGFGGLAVEV
jgi:hypothetical protein